MQGSAGGAVADAVGVLSPFSAAFALPLDVSLGDNAGATASSGDLPMFFGYLGWSLVYNTGLILMMTRLFQVRWRVAD